MEIVKDPVVKGLYRRIGESSATWYVQGRINNGSVTRVKLGRVALMSVSQARHAAKQALVQMASGINPNKAKAEKRVRGITLTDAINQVLTEKSSVLKRLLLKITARCSSGTSVTGGINPLDRLLPKTLPNDMPILGRASKSDHGYPK